MTKYNGYKGSKVLTVGTTAYRKLEAVADMLAIESPNGYAYYVDTCWEDYGAGMAWTTILRTGSEWGDVQVLTPRMWDEIALATTAVELARCVADIRSDRFFGDKEETLA